MDKKAMADSVFQKIHEVVEQAADVAYGLSEAVIEDTVNRAKEFLDTVESGVRERLGEDSPTREEVDPDLATKVEDIIAFRQERGSNAVTLTNFRDRGLFKEDTVSVGNRTYLEGEWNRLPDEYKTKAYKQA